MNQIPEIEDKYILKRIPKLIWDDVIHIEQYYVPEENGNLRIRFNFNHHSMLFSQGTFRSVECIRKEKVGRNSNIEHHEELDVNKAWVLQQNAERVMKKIRHVHKLESGHKLEIDYMLSAHLIMMEIEKNSEDEVVEIPEEVRNLIIADVTGMKEFNNYQLAEKLNIKQHA